MVALKSRINLSSAISLYTSKSLRCHVRFFFFFIIYLPSMISRNVKISLKTRSNVATLFRISLPTARSSNNNKLLIMLSYTTYKKKLYLKITRVIILERTLIKLNLLVNPTRRRKALTRSVYLLAFHKQPTVQSYRIWPIGGGGNRI